jgi:type I restriction enzyme S subunit
MRFEPHEQERYGLRFGDIVMCEGGEPGRCAIWKGAPGMMIQKALHRIRPHDSIDHRFLYYTFLHTGRTGGFEGLLTGSTIKHLPREKLAKLEIRFPSLFAQLRIASQLSAYDDLIENNRRRIQLLEESARLLYREWFVHLRFPGHEHVRVVDGVPKGWQHRTAIDVMEVLSGGTPKTDIADYWDGDIPFFTPKDTTNHAYVLDTEKHLTDVGLSRCNSRLYPKDTLFITARGTVGKLNLAQVPMAMNQSCYALIARPPLTQHYLYCALGSAIAQFKSRAVGAVFDAIVIDTFKTIPFLVPDEPIVRNFSDNVSKIFRQTEVLSMQIVKLQQARDLLLPRLMSGDITV